MEKSHITFHLNSPATYQRYHSSPLCWCEAVELLLPEIARPRSEASPGGSRSWLFPLPSELSLPASVIKPAIEQDEKFCFTIHKHKHPLYRRGSRLASQTTWNKHVSPSFWNKYPQTTSYMWNWMTMCRITCPSYSFSEYHEHPTYILNAEWGCP